jgi:hypothetical protein
MIDYNLLVVKSDSPAQMSIPSNAQPDLDARIEYGQLRDRFVDKPGKTAWYYIFRLHFFLRRGESRPKSRLISPASVSRPAGQADRAEPWRRAFRAARRRPTTTARSARIFGLIGPCYNARIVNGRPIFSPEDFAVLRIKMHQILSSLTHRGGAW